MSIDRIDLTNTRLFTPYTHPESGVTIYVLTRKVAPVQEAFYFSNDSFSADGRYLWFYCASRLRAALLGVAPWGYWILKPWR